MMLKDSTGKTLACSIAVADSFWKRAKGLLGRKSVELDEGLLLVNCSSVHMIGMRISLDVLFLDENYSVLSLRERLSPFKTASHKSAKHTLELAAGAAHKYGINVGDRIRLEVI